jgi:hypothetical protein
MRSSAWVGASSVARNAVSRSIGPGYVAPLHSPVVRRTPGISCEAPMPVEAAPGFVSFIPLFGVLHAPYTSTISAAPAS